MQQGEQVDRVKITSLVADMQILVNSGAFATADLTALEKEFASLAAATLGVRMEISEW